MTDERDDFWDLPSITPKRRGPLPGSAQSPDTDAAEVSFGTGSGSKKYVIPLRGREPEKRSEVILRYTPDNSLILDVKICRWPTDYSYYNRFLQDAEKYYRAKCDDAPFVPFFSYMPQYNQMNIDQLRFYLYWRRQVGHGNFIKTDYSYIFLYLYELINLESVSTPEKRLAAMCSLLLGYRDSFRSLDKYVGEWICDFCLIHRLPPPELPAGVTDELMSVVALREFFVRDRENIHDTALRDFIIRNNTYKYENSAAYNETTKPLFDRHLVRSVIYTLEKTENIKDGEPELSRTRVSRTAYNGALCVSGTKCRIDAEYLSLNRSYRFRGMISSLVKCAENNIRAAAGIRSRLSVSGISAEVSSVMREYFDSNLPAVRNHPAKKKQDDGVRYELYDAASTGFDPGAAAKLEESSWELTRRLVEEEEDTDPEQSSGALPDAAESDAPAPGDDENGYVSLCRSLPEQLLTVLKLTAEGDGDGVRLYCLQNGVLPDAAYSDINSAAYEHTGDIIIENGAIIEDYEHDVSDALNMIR